MTREQFLDITDRQHLSNIRKNPIRFLKTSGKGFFIDAEGHAIALRKDLEPVIGNLVMKEQMRDIIEYRTIEYYRRRYRYNS
jgi:hypothetical protein